MGGRRGGSPAAADMSGAAQPFGYDPDLNGFEVNQVQPSTVKIGSAREGLARWAQKSRGSPPASLCLSV